MSSTTKMYNLDNPAYLEAKGLSLVWEAYYQNCPREDIMEIGFNDQSGYVYIALENIGVSIASAFGQDVEYIVTDWVTGEEYFEDSMDEAVEKLEQLNNKYDNE